jgi:CBS domain-containing protein
VVIVEKWGERLKPVGIFTERDYLFKIAGRETVAAPVPPPGSPRSPGQPPAEEGIEALPVERFMTPAPTTLPIDAALDRALQVMSAGGYRHLPLVDGEGHLAGILSVRDIIVYLAELFPTACINLPRSNQSIDTREGE